MEVVDDDKCVLRNQASENIPHLFFEGCFSKTIWIKKLTACSINRKGMGWRQGVSWFCSHANSKSLLSKLRRLSFSTAVYFL